MPQTLLIFFFIMTGGALWNNIPQLPPGTKVRALINPLVLNLLLPLLVYRAFVLTPLHTEIWKIPVAAALGCMITLLITAGLLHLIEKKFRRKIDRPAKGALLLAAAWGNVTYLGIPLLTSWIGEKAQMLAVLYDLAALSPLLFVVGAEIGRRLGADQSPSKTYAPLGAILRLPPLWAALAGVASLESGLSAWLPSWILQLCKGAAMCVGPLMIFSVGLALRIPKSRRLLLMAPAVFSKLVVSPLIVYGLSRSFALSGDYLRAETLEAAMPTMVLTLVISERFKLDTELLAQCIAVSTLLAFILLPLVNALL